MTLTGFDSSRFLSLTSLVLAMASGGCVTHVADHGTPHHPAPPPATGPYQPAPPTSGPHQPAARCALDAPTMYVVERAPAHAAGEPFETLHILESGAWIATDHQGQRTGCLDDGQMYELGDALAAADFAPQPSQVTCAALPTTTVTVHDAARQRRISYSTPCGQPVHASIHELVRVTGAWTHAMAETPSAPPATPLPPPPAAPACAMDGTPIYHETHWSSNEPQSEIVVYPSGAWQHTAGGQTRRGCLSTRERAIVEQRINDAQMQAQMVTGPNCKALPTERHRIVTPRGTVIWNAPCGDRTPPASLLELQRQVRAALGA